MKKGKKPRSNEYPRYGTKQSDGEGPLMLEFEVRQSTSSLLLIPDPLWPGLVALDRVLSMGQKELFYILNWVQTNDLCQIKL